ncbi:hypothetical protein, partial [Mesorhizobium sp. M7A.T.Ca.TU.009.02.1.1]|uniref:hypothetical protein n=1 Tax=Mesorhizobium sp. M7A.T.Ca.TU.009.02.1.1 TaxID=2496791 RepID=UPI0019CF8B9E
HQHSPVCSSGGKAGAGRVSFFAGSQMLQSRGPAPPSVLPDISPSSGEIGSFADRAFLQR